MKQKLKTGKHPVEEGGIFRAGRQLVVSSCFCLESLGPLLLLPHHLLSWAEEDNKVNKEAPPLGGGVSPLFTIQLLCGNATYFPLTSSLAAYSLLTPQKHRNCMVLAQWPMAQWPMTQRGNNPQLMELFS